MKRMKRFLSVGFIISICLVLSLALFSCKKDGDGDETTGATDTSGVPANATELSIFDGSAFAGKLVYASSADDLRKEVSNALKEKLGERPEAVEDTEVEADSSVVEILLGGTNRPESTAIDGVGESDAWYFVGIIGNKLVINGSNSYMLGLAVDHFINTYIASGAESTPFVAIIDNNCKTVWADYASSEWAILELPYYKGANVLYSSASFTSGKLLTEYIDSDADTAKVLSVSKTSAEEFEAYADRLESFGYKEVYRDKLDGTTYVTLTKGTEMAYIYLNASKGYAKIVYDPVSDTVADISTKAVTAKSGEGAVFYQYGLNMGGGDFPATGVEGCPNNGMMYIVKCADNGLIIFDGGAAAQMSAEPAAALNDFLHEITGTEEGEKVTVNAWILTHLHGDHYAGFMEFIGSYASQYDLKAICSNVPYAIAKEMEANCVSQMTNYGNTLSIRYPELKEIVIHTGQKLTFGDVTVQALFTPDDTINTLTGKSSITQFNDTSCIFKVSADDMSMMILGDAADKSEDFLIAEYSADTLKCDIVQVAHHANNGVDNIYDYVKASIYFVPQSYGGFQDRDGVGYEDRNWEEYIRGELLEGKIFPTYAENYGEEGEMIFFAGKSEMTVGLQVIDGEITVVHQPEEIDKSQPVTSKGDTSDEFEDIDFI